MKIAFIDYVLDPYKPGRSGLSDLVWDMASALTKMGHSVHIVGSYQTQEYPDVSVHVHNFELPPVGYRNIVGHCLIIAKATEILRQLDPDVVHAPEYLSTAIMSLMGLRVPLVLTVPGNIFHRLSDPKGSSYEWHFAQVLKWAARRSARKCSKVIAISEAMQYWWERTGSRHENTPVIPLGVNPERFYYRADARVTLDIPKDLLVISYIGRFSIEKGVLDLIGALGRLKETGIAAKLRVYMIGSGPLFDEVEQQVSRHCVGDIVEIRRWVPQEDLPSWYSASDAVVLPSYTEGLSRVLLEAMTCGTPVIGSITSGTEDHVREGITGYLFKPGDVERLTEILLDVCERPLALSAMRNDVESYAKRVFSLQSIMERIVLEVYSGLVTTS